MINDNNKTLKEIRPEVLRTLKFLAFSTLKNLKKAMWENKKYGPWNSIGNRNTPAFEKLEREIKIWTDILNLAPAAFLKVAGREATRGEYYCGHYFSYKSRVKEVNKLISLEEDERNKIADTWTLFRAFKAEDYEGEFYENLGFWWGSGHKTKEFFEGEIKRIKELLKDDKDDFEKWESKGRRTREISKGIKEAKSVVNNASSETGITIKSFCCSVMGAIRDFMIKEGIENYKEATCELGQKRKEAVRSLVCYSKTQDSQKVQNFKEQVRKSPYSSRFLNWPELAEIIKVLEASFIK